MDLYLSLSKPHNEDGNEGDAGPTFQEQLVTLLEEEEKEIPTHEEVEKVKDNEKLLEL